MTSSEKEILSINRNMLKDLTTQFLIIKEYGTAILRRYMLHRPHRIFKK